MSVIPVIIVLFVMFLLIIGTMAIILSANDEDYWQ